MVLALGTIWNDGGLSVRVENHRDRFVQDIPPSCSGTYIGARWVGKGKGRTVLSITSDGEGDRASGSSSRRTAVVSLEDINWHLVIKGDVEGGSQSIKVNGNKDFDVVVREDGKLAIRCLGGTFSNGLIEQVVDLPPLSSHLNGATAPAIGSSSHSPSQSIPPADTSTASFASSPSSFSFKEISPDLAELLDELRADQRRVLQREFQSVGAGFAERLLSGGARLMGAAEPKDYLPIISLINLLIVPLLFLIPYTIGLRRSRSLKRSRSPPAPPVRRRSSSPSTSNLLSSATSAPASETRRSRRNRLRSRPGGWSGDLYASFSRMIADGEDDYGGQPPPPYPVHEGRSLF